MIKDREDRKNLLTIIEHLMYSRHPSQQPYELSVTNLTVHMKKQEPGGGVGWMNCLWSCGYQGKPMLHHAFLSLSIAALEMFPFGF